MVFDGDFGEVADGEFEGDEDSAVDVRGVPVGAGDAGFFDEDAEGFSELAFVDPGGGLVDGGIEFAVAFFDGGVVEVAFHFHGAGSFFF